MQNSTSASNPLRVIVKILIVLAMMGPVVAYCAAFNIVEAVSCILCMLGAAAGVLLVRGKVRMAPPSRPLLLWTLAGAAVGYALGGVVAAILFDVLMAMIGVLVWVLVILLLLSIPFALAGMAVTAASRADSLIEAASHGRLSDTERYELQQLVTHHGVSHDTRYSAKAERVFDQERIKR